MTIISYFIDIILNISPVVIPNIIASIMLMFDKGYYSNIIYIPGYALMIWYNSTLNNPTQIFYFSFLEICAIIGVIYYNYKIKKRGMKLLTKGKFINRSGFPDQLSKKNKNDVGLDIKAVLTQFDADGNDITEIPIDTAIYGPAGVVYACNVDSITILPHGRACVHAMVNLAVPDDCYGQLASRSGLCRDYGITIESGVLDAGYRGLVQIMVFNQGFFPFELKNGAKIAQLLTIKVNLEPYEQVESLEETDRGTRGFGSSGV